MNTIATPRASMTEDQLIELFADWKAANGFADYEGDAEDLQATEELLYDQRRWLIGYCAAWNAMVERSNLQAKADKALEIAAFEIGPREMRRFIRVLHCVTDPFDLYLVEDFTKCDDEEPEPSAFHQFANLSLAFAKAVELTQEEIADVCDTLGV